MRRGLRLQAGLRLPNSGPTPEQGHGSQKWPNLNSKVSKSIESDLHDFQRHFLPILAFPDVRYCTDCNFLEFCRKIRKSPQKFKIHRISISMAFGRVSVGFRLISFIFGSFQKYGHFRHSRPLPEDGLGPAYSLKCVAAAGRSCPWHRNFT